MAIEFGSRKETFDNFKVYETMLAGRPFKVEMGKMCGLSNASALIRYGETCVMCNVVMSPKPREGVDFFPLTVEYEEKLYAAGRIPGSFMRREGRPGEHAILSSRVVDRPIRPLLPKDMRNDVCVTMTVMSLDPDCSAEISGMNGASLAIAMSDIPWGGPIAGVFVGLVDGEIVLNPTKEQREHSDLSLTLAASEEKIVMIEQGQAIENRRCPKAKTGRCMNCKPYCHITTGFSGAGAFSDGKLSLCSDVGGDLPTLVGEQKAQELIDYADSIYLEFGADEHVEGLENTEEIKQIRTRAIRAGLRLVDCPIRHLGTEKAHEVYLGIENYLRDHGVEMLFGCTCEDVILRDGRCCGVVAHDGHQDYTIEARHTVIATGRRGADWLEKDRLENGVEHKPGTVDIGVRVEVRNEIMESVNRVLYESKLIGYPAPFKNKVRTFCQNPGGFVSQENYDNDLAVVNGHAYKELKSPNTNVAILCSHNFSVPFNQPIAYAQKVGELTNMLGAGHIMVQRFGDILDGKRTWQKELMQSNVRPTLPDAVAGDITSAMPYRAMLNIINFIKAMDEVVPGFAAYETLLYSPELKFYSNRIAMDADLNTNVPGLHCLGDSSGWTRGLMMASAMGVLMGRKLAGML